MRENFYFCEERGSFLASPVLSSRPSPLHRGGEVKGVLGGTPPGVEVTDLEKKKNTLSTSISHNKSVHIYLVPLQLPRVEPLCPRPPSVAPQPLHPAVAGAVSNVESELV